MLKKLFADTEYTIDDVDGIGTTGYGRINIGKQLNAELVQEELSVNAKGAVYLADHQKRGSYCIGYWGYG